MKNFTHKFEPDVAKAIKSRAYTTIAENGVSRESYVANVIFPKPRARHILNPLDPALYDGGVNATPMAIHSVVPVSSALGTAWQMRVKDYFPDFGMLICYLDCWTVGRALGIHYPEGVNPHVWDEDRIPIPGHAMGTVMLWVHKRPVIQPYAISRLSVKNPEREIVSEKPTPGAPKFDRPAPEYQKRNPAAPKAPPVAHEYVPAGGDIPTIT